MDPDRLSLTRLVIEHLDRRRRAIRGDVARAREEVRRCLVPVSRAAAKDEPDDRPPPWLRSLERELLETLPERFCAQAERMTQLEDRDFDVWRGGDLVARLTYVFISALAVAVLAATEASLLVKWIALLLAFGSFWLPGLQLSWHRRDWERRLDSMAREVSEPPRALAGAVDLDEGERPAYLPPPSRLDRGEPSADDESAIARTYHRAFRPC